MRFSELGTRLSGHSGINDLMADLGQALGSSSDHAPLMLGGGNPAHIPAMERVWEKRMKEIISDPLVLRRTLAIYDPPRGNPECLKALAELLRSEFGWPVGPKNIAVTPGGRTAFFLLFNLFAGGTSDSRANGGADSERGRILFPLMPEYIGYADQALTPDSFTALKPTIEITGPHQFKYRIDFDHLDRLSHDPSLRALCVSRPTNPSGNVITDDEMNHLAEFAARHDLPLIVDNAYGWPFPGILFDEVTPLWTDQTIHVMSLSKFGLPGTRTAFVVGPPAVAAAIASMTAITGLANGNFGQAIAGPLIQSGEITRLSKEVIRPYYLAKREKALAAVDEYFPDEAPYYVHECGGAMFLWLWIKDSKRTSREIYEALKKRGVLVVPGEYFFFGLEEQEWPHRHECLRISFAMDDEEVREGIRIIANELFGG
ncbi:MAG: valine--pyruvate transaminase [bacterium]